MPEIMLKTGAIVPAAGYSSRMGACKATMEILGLPAMEWVVSNLRQAGIEEILVVTGHWREKIDPLAQALGCKTVHNERYEDGMFSSVRKALEAMPVSWDRFLFLPVDIPMVKAATLSRLASLAGSSTVAYPTFLGKRGHPPIIDRKSVSKILGWDGEMGLRGALNLLEDQSSEIPVVDRFILCDMDDREDHVNLSSMASNRTIPSEEEIRALETMYETPTRVIRHEKQVTETALKMANLLIERGTKLDLPLLKAAASLHDLCRTEKKHGKVGAEALRSHGFPSVASLVELHMDYPYDGVLDEGALLYLADKLTCDDRICSPDERLAGMLAKFKDRSEARKNAARRLEKAKKMLDDFSKAIGRDGMEELR